METLQCTILTIVSFALFIHLTIGSGLLDPKTPFYIYFPLLATNFCNVLVFFGAIAGFLEFAKNAATFAFMFGGLYAIVLYFNGVLIHKYLNEPSNQTLHPNR